MKGRKMTKNRIMSVVMAVVMGLSMLTVQYASGTVKKVEAASYNYNVEAAMSYAEANWNSSADNDCAYFVSDCVRAGGLSVGRYGYAIDIFDAVASATGVSAQYLTLDSNGYAHKDQNQNKLSRGDIVISACEDYGHSKYPHVMICGGYDSSGYATFYAHSYSRHNERVPVATGQCYTCYRSGAQLKGKVLHISNTDTIPPEIKNIKVTNLNSNGYKVECDVSDNKGIDRVEMPTWTEKDRQDDLAHPWPKATVSNGHATLNVRISDHNNESGRYNTHIYVWDINGNKTVVNLFILVPDKTISIINPSKDYPIPVRKIEDGISGDDVRWIQEGLNKLIKCNLSLDGVCGPNTVKAIKNYQSLRNLKVDGIAGIDTVSQMLIEWRKIVEDEMIKAPTIEKQPISVTKIRGSIGKFTVEAYGDNLKYQWYVSSDGGNTWKISSGTGNNTKTISLRATKSLNGRKYKCIISNKGGSIESSIVTFVTKEVISGQPSDQVAFDGDTVSFSVKSRSTVAKYQWEYSDDNGLTWKKSNATGNNAKTISFTSRTKQNGFMYRCKVTNGTWVEYSKEVTLFVKGKIIEQPDSIAVNKGKIATFRINVLGTDLEYQWQVSTDGGKKWKNSSAAGNKTNEINFKTTLKQNGYMYRCVVINGYVKTYSTAATLIVR